MPEMNRANSMNRMDAAFRMCPHSNRLGFFVPEILSLRSPKHSNEASTGNIANTVLYRIPVNSSDRIRWSTRRRSVKLARTLGQQGISRWRSWLTTETSATGLRPWVGVIFTPRTTCCRSCRGFWRTCGPRRRTRRSASRARAPAGDAGKTNRTRPHTWTRAGACGKIPSSPMVMTDYKNKVM